MGQKQGRYKSWISGDIRWYKDGQLHREGGPAYKLKNGSKAWCKNGLLHREDGPAIERANGSKVWYINGLRHREDGPAIERADGSKEWYKNDQLHREDGPAIEKANGTKEWYKNGKLHREDGPAIEWNTGRKYWYLHGHLYRIDGPTWTGSQQPKPDQEPKLIQDEIAQDGTDDLLICTVCKTNRRNTLLRPCNHEATCLACANKIKTANSRCPICRTPITETLTIYKA